MPRVMYRDVNTGKLSQKDPMLKTEPVFKNAAERKKLKAPKKKTKRGGKGGRS